MFVRLSPTATGPPCRSNQFEASVAENDGEGAGFQRGSPQREGWITRDGSLRLHRAAPMSQVALAADSAALS
jgi:hypothetical protein